MVSAPRCCYVLRSIPTQNLLQSNQPVVPVENIYTHHQGQELSHTQRQKYKTEHPSATSGTNCTSALVNLHRAIIHLRPALAHVLLARLCYITRSASPGRIDHSSAESRERWRAIIAVRASRTGAHRSTGEQRTSAVDALSMSASAAHRLPRCSCVVESRLRCQGVSLTRCRAQES